MIIADTEGLQQHVRRLMHADNGERVIAVAFIGRDALRYIPDPAGTTIYCWDNVAGTHPDGIEDLFNSGATVKFVDRLHMKIFWAQKAGALIGSANLSNNALGNPASALFEAAYFTDDSSEINIQALRRRLERKAREITPAALNAYRKRYFAASARRDRIRSARQPSAIPTFSDYVKGSHRKPWVLAAYDMDDVKFTRVDIAAANKSAESEGYRGDKHGLGLVRDAIETYGRANPGDWILRYEYKANGEMRALRWMYVHALSDRKNPTALELIFDTGRIPFQLDAPLKKALRAYITAKGLDPRYNDIRFTDAQLRGVLKFYAAERRRGRR